MASAQIEKLTKTAAEATEPSFVATTVPAPGGVDPLGLRQINLDMMDQIFPGLNNVARHIRPFVIVTWAWRRAHQLARASGVANIKSDELCDFVDRIEVIYAWSQFLKNPDADLPGRRVLSPILESHRWVFGGAPWKKRREERRYSTAFTAPINYGPGLKRLGWVQSHREHSDVLIPTEASEPALNSLEARIQDRLDHPAFGRLGEVEVVRQDVVRWTGGWALAATTNVEKRVMAKMLIGSNAPVARRNGISLVHAAVKYSASTEVEVVRRTMVGTPLDFIPPVDLSGTALYWRRIQVRQLFRLTLEALLYWTILQIENGPKSIDSLVTTFLDHTTRPERDTAHEWLKNPDLVTLGPIEHMTRIESALDDVAHNQLALNILNGLAFALAEAPEHGEVFERSDRLPLFRARREANAWGMAPAKDFVRHILESWVLAQHVYWSVGRGLADARARGKSLLRLKVVLEENGWTLAPSISRGARPVPTPDRLRTALNLAFECGLLTTAD